MTRLKDLATHCGNPKTKHGNITALKLVRAEERSFTQNTEGGQNRITALSFTPEEGDTAGFLKTLTLGKDDQALEYLYLSGCTALESLVFEPDCTFKHLTHLYLDGCNLTELKIPVGCDKLAQIYVQKQVSKLKSLVFEGNCRALLLLDASENDLAAFNMPVIFEDLAYLYLKGNENIANIPKEIYQNKVNCWEDVRNYLDSSSQKAYLHEAKLILIGNGEVGKSSIRTKLMDEKAVLPKKNERTLGLHETIEPYLVKKIEPQFTNLKRNIDFKLNIWDFGGQGRYREVQALFCSRKSLYVFVTSPEDTLDNEDYVGHDYWLSMANAFSSEQKEGETVLSPVIYVLNKMDLNTGDKTIQETDIKKRYGNVESFIKISCQTLHNFPELKTAIRLALPKIGADIFSDKYALNWLKVKAELEEKARKGVNYISKSAYFDLCKKEEMNESEAETWLGVLDRIGTVLYFSKHYEDKTLKDFIVLNPNWVRDAVCKVLDTPLIQDGRFYPAQFSTVWNEYTTVESFFQKVKNIFTAKKYTQSEHEKLLALMCMYKLCYPQTDQFNQPFYAIPALWKNKKPNIPPALQKMDYQIRFKYAPIIPAGTLNKLIVTLNELILNDFKWKNGVILHHIETSTYAKLTESWQEQCIYLNLKGNNPKALFGLVFNTLQGLLNDLKNTKLLNQLGFEIEADEDADGDWMTKKQLKKRNVEKYSFLWDTHKDGRGEGFEPLFLKEKQPQTALDAVESERKVKDLLEQDKTEEALDVIKTWASNYGDKAAQQNIIVLKGEWARLKREGNMGIAENAKQGHNSINYKILNFEWSTE